MKTVAWVAGLAAALMSSSAFAGVLYSNSYAYTGGNCAFSTTCAGTIGAGNDFAAQEFTLNKTSVVTGADFIELDYRVAPTAVTWGLIQANGAGGLPGTILWSGTDSLSRQIVGSDSTYNLSRMSWNTGGVVLGPGTYYLAMQAISPAYDTYLGGGTAWSGAAESHDGGVTWWPNYAVGPNGAPISSVAVDIFGSALPEPGAWALMIVGLAGIGALLRRRQTLAAA